MRRRPLLALVLALGACAPALPAPAPAPPPAPRPGEVARWDYAVSVGPGARELAIEAVIPAGEGAVLTVDEGAEPFVAGAECARGGTFAPVARTVDPHDGPVWHLPPCPASGCRVRYRFALGEAARAIGKVGVASWESGAIVSPPSAWLLWPVDPPSGQRFRVRVEAPPGAAFVSGLFPVDDGGAARQAELPPQAPLVDGAYEGDVADLHRAPYAAFGDLRVERREAGGTRVDVALAPGAFDVGDAAIADWVRGAALLVRDYMGRDPVPRVLVVIAPRAGRGVGYGLTMGGGGAAIFAPVGRSTTAADLADTWEMVHEMLHVAFPMLPRASRWFAEGVATYVEPILRARRGLITPERAFFRLQRRMHHGLPREGDEGLDRTPTWGRTYWGGALFCLLADVEIRQRTGGRRSLDDALRGILAAGGNVAARWEIARAIAAGDAATGVPVLAELHARMGSAPGTVDLDDLWRRLGVVPAGDGVRFDDAAPLASTRRAIVDGG